MFLVEMSRTGGWLYEARKVLMPLRHFLEVAFLRVFLSCINYGKSDFDVVKR
jgi:hypothetical protein